MADEQNISIPQLLLVLLIGGIAIRWFFFGGASSRTTGSNSSASSLRAREADVDRIQQMFPQIARRTIMWDLQRNGGNVAATTERILNGRGLETPPQTFQPPLPTPASSSTSTSESALARPKPSQPDLIARYNLAAKVAIADQGTEITDSTSTNNGRSAWSANKSERQALLQKRREEMILTARRKMQAKLATGAGQGGGGDAADLGRSIVG